MKKVGSIFVAALIAVLAAVSAGALQSPDYPGLEFANDTDDNLVVSGYTGSNPVLEIPEKIYDKNVLRIGEKSLKGNSVISSLIMNDNMTNIRARALYQCPNLSYVYYSKNLEVIWDYAFGYNKTNITSAFLRNTAVREIGAGAYMECNNLEYLSLPDTLEQLDGTVFNNTAIRKVYLPGDVKTIGARCFAYCSNLKEVYVPASVTSIGTDVFFGSDNLTVYTPENSAMYEYCQSNGINCAVLGEDKFPSRLLGDTNGDYDLTINDVTFIQRELAGYKTDFCADNCDFNGDCKLDINDATMLQLKLVGLI